MLPQPTQQSAKLVIDQSTILDKWFILVDCTIEGVRYSEAISRYAKPSDYEVARTLDSWINDIRTER